MDSREILENLDAEALRRRLDEIDGERQATMILLRAAVRLERDKAEAPQERADA